VNRLLLETFPYLNDPPDGQLDAPLPPPPSSDEIEWIGNLIPIDEQSESAHTATWGDVALSLGARIMDECRRNVKEKLRYTCSAGIAKNKMLAKLCSAWKKPDDQVLSSIPSFDYCDLPFLFVISSPAVRPS
jgi:DNA polymerase eta